MSLKLIGKWEGNFLGNNTSYNDILQLDNGLNDHKRCCQHELIIISPTIIQIVLNPFYRCGNRQRAYSLSYSSLYAFIVDWEKEVL